MLKRTISLLLALVMVASLCACGGGEKEPTAPTASTPAAPSNSTPTAPAASTPEPEPAGPKLVTHTWTENKYYTISLEAPETVSAEEPEPAASAPADGETSEPEEPDNIFDFTKDSGSWEFTFLGDTFKIEFEIDNYTYNTSTDWKEKYGETDPSFEDFKKYVEEGINSMTGTIIQVNGEEVVERPWNDSLFRFYNTDGMREEGEKNLECKVKFISLDESVVIDDLMKDETVKAIFDSIKIEGK